MVMINKDDEHSMIKHLALVEKVGIFAAKQCRDGGLPPTHILNILMAAMAVSLSVTVKTAKFMDVDIAPFLRDYKELAEDFIKLVEGEM